MNIRHILLALSIPLLSGCEMVYDLLEIPNPQKEAAIAQAEGQAIGSACRQGGRSLEDCYILNPDAEKASVFKGWREMNDYMIQNSMEIVPSQLTPKTPPVKAAPPSDMDMPDITPPGPPHDAPSHDGLPPEPPAQ